MTLSHFLRRCVIRHRGIECASSRLARSEALTETACADPSVSYRLLERRARSMILEDKISLSLSLSRSLSVLGCNFPLSDSHCVYTVTMHFPSLCSSREKCRNAVDKILRATSVCRTVLRRKKKTEGNRKRDIGLNRWNDVLAATELTCGRNGETRRSCSAR